MPALTQSVVICTRNPRTDYFCRTLAALRAQSRSLDRWELVIVDNCCDQPLAGRVDLGWHPAAHITREETLGLTPARLRGIREARGELLVFVDDDNVLDPDYLDEAARVADEKPFLGAWSGQCRPEFEAAPPDWSRRYFGNLALAEFDDDVWSNLPRMAETLPWGAGLCIRRDAAQHYLALHEAGARAVQLDRAGASLLSGGDQDLAACACDIGLGAGRIAALRLTHLIPPERLTVDYQTRLIEGIYFSRTLLDAMRGLRTSTRKPLGKLVDLVRTLRLTPPHRQILRAAYRGRNRASEMLASQRNR